MATAQQIRAQYEARAERRAARQALHGAYGSIHLSVSPSEPDIDVEYSAAERERELDAELLQRQYPMPTGKSQQEDLMWQLHRCEYCTRFLESWYWMAPEELARLIRQHENECPYNYAAANMDWMDRIDQIDDAWFEYEATIHCDCHICRDDEPDELDWLDAEEANLAAAELNLAIASLGTAAARDNLAAKRRRADKRRRYARNDRRDHGDLGRQTHDKNCYGPVPIDLYIARHDPDFGDADGCGGYDPDDHWTDAQLDIEFIWDGNEPNAEIDGADAFVLGPPIVILDGGSQPTVPVEGEDEEYYIALFMVMSEAPHHPNFDPDGEPDPYADINLGRDPFRSIPDDNRPLIPHRGDTGLFIPMTPGGDDPFDDNPADFGWHVSQS